MGRDREQKDQEIQQAHEDMQAGQRAAQDQAIDPGEQLDFANRIDPLLSDLNDMYNEAGGDFALGLKYAIDSITQRFRIPPGVAGAPSGDDVPLIDQTESAQLNQANAVNPESYVDNQPPNAEENPPAHEDPADEDTNSGE